MAHTPVHRWKCPDDPSAEFMAFRWYIPSRALGQATENARRFHWWILALKNGNREAREFAVWLLEHHLPPLSSARLVISAPTSRKSETGTAFPLFKVADAFVRRFGLAAALPILRAQAVPSAVDSSEMRAPGVQLETMHLPKRRPAAAPVILVIDDVTTSGATLEACRLLVRGAYPTAWIILFAFGKTRGAGNTAFPEDPAFPG
jgi:predicted amidophosphoribosyltransferase